jgi:hypothetical protein
MNYFIENHDMEIILDALECLIECIKEEKQFYGKNTDYPWTIDEVDSLFQSFDNSFVEET